MRRSPLSSWLAAALSLPFALAGSAWAAEPITVAASIKPVHSLVAAVMQGAGSPHLIVPGGASPHSYSLKPSDAAALQKAKVVVWVGEGLEAFLETSIATLARDAEVVELAEVPGLKRLDYREGGPWAEHDDDHDDDGEHHDELPAAEADHDHEHGHDDIDMHLWLDPDNAKAMVAAIAEALMQADPDNSGIYRANAEIMARRLDQLSAEIEADLAAVKDIPFVVFHDGYQYLDTRFGLRNVGSVTVNPEQQPGAARLKEIHAKIAELGARCVFSEPQFQPRLVQVVIEGTAAKTGVLDPLGADLPDGPELYFELMRANAAALKTCLGEAS
jgi:zinc transport system substrate-binding protein